MLSIKKKKNNESLKLKKGNSLFKQLYFCDYTINGFILRQGIYNLDLSPFYP